MVASATGRGGVALLLRGGAGRRARPDGLVVAAQGGEHGARRVRAPAAPGRRRARGARRPGADAPSDGRRAWALGRRRPPPRRPPAKEEKAAGRRRLPEAKLCPTPIWQAKPRRPRPRRAVGRRPRRRRRAGGGHRRRHPAAANKTLPQTLHALASQPDGADARAGRGGARGGEGGGIDALPAGGHDADGGGGGGRGGGGEALVEAGASANALDGRRPGCSPSSSGRGGHPHSSHSSARARASTRRPSARTSAARVRLGAGAAGGGRRRPPAAASGCSSRRRRAPSCRTPLGPHPLRRRSRTATCRRAPPPPADVLAADAAAHPANGDAAPAAADASEYVAVPDSTLEQAAARPPSKRAAPVDEATGAERLARHPGPKIAEMTYDVEDVD